MRSTNQGGRRRMLWLTLLLSTSATAKEATIPVNKRPTREGGTRRRRRLPQTHNHHHDLTRRPDHGRHPTYRKLSTECTTLQQQFLLSFQTDSYGGETSWFLRTAPNADGSPEEYIGYGPPTGATYGGITVYSFSYCLTIGSTYTLAMEDDFGDGMCCSRGVGGYEYSLGGVRVYSTELRHTFDQYVEHTFTVEHQYSPAPTEYPTGQPYVETECVSNSEECGCEEDDQEDYRGTISQTESGLECQAWAAQTPHTHEYSAQAWPVWDLISNFCRSPGGGKPWCLTTDPEVEWEYCRVPFCATREVVDTLGPTERPTTSNPTGSGPTTPQPTERPTTLSPTGMGPTPLPTKEPTPFPTLSPVKAPTNPPTPQPTPNPTPGYNVYNPQNGCYGGDVKAKIEVRADKWSTDTSWELRHPNGTKLLHVPEFSYAPYEYRYSELCIPHGKYTFVIADKYGDGMCCRYGEGFFRVHLDDRLVLNGGSYNENVTATLLVGHNPDGLMSEREHLYLEAHNTRRKEWHEDNGLDYVPLVYSPALAVKAKAWADELLWSCGVIGIEHEILNPFGENLAKNTGQAASWGQLYPPNNIVGRWVDFEIGLPYPSNGHLTQALWRASMYLGCGESVRTFRGGVCRIQVCRYGRAGNCDMKRFNSTEGENWLAPMLDNYTRCGPDCPPEGCF